MAAKEVGDAQECICLFVPFFSGGARLLRGGPDGLQDGIALEVNEEGNPEVIFDAGKNRVVFFNGENQTYVQTTPKEWCSETKAQYEAMLEQMPSESREQMKEMMEKSKMNFSMKKEGSEKVGDFNTTKYVILKNGQPYEYYWISNDEKLLKDAGNRGKLIDLMSEISECMLQGIDAEGSFVKAYREVFKQGLPIKNVDAEEATGDAEEVEIEFRDLPASTFETPEDYSKISIREMMEEG